MPHVKTSISIEKSIFDEANAMAEVLSISRSRLFVIAVQDFLKRRNNEALVKALDDTYDDLPDQGSQSELVEKMREHHVEIVKDSW